jgi:hypothetical protein
LLIKFCFRVDFLIFASRRIYSSLICESCWAIRLFAGSVVASAIPLRGSCKCGFGGKFLKMDSFPAWGSFSPVLRVFSTGTIRNTHCFQQQKNILPLSLGLGLNARSNHRVSSLYAEKRKSKKFDTKTKFYKQTNTLHECRNFRSIE